jgi:ABC-type uncharacterized transport system substrate-binding protein
VIEPGSINCRRGQDKEAADDVPNRSDVVGGGLASYGPSYYAVGRLAATYVHRVLLGASPADLPVQRFDRFELVLNGRTAREIGLTIPPSVLVRADEVIK